MSANANPKPLDEIECVQLRETPGVTMSIELVTLDGDSWIFPYSYLVFAHCTPDALSIRFSSHTCHIKGRNLAPVVEALRQQRIEVLRAEPSKYDLGFNESSFISDIQVCAREDE